MRDVPAVRLTPVLLLQLVAAIACSPEGPGAAGRDLSPEESALRELLDAYDAGDCATVMARAPGFRATTDLRLAAAAYVYGRCFYLAGDDARAEAVLAPAADRDPPNLYSARASYFRARALFRLGRFADARARFDALLARFPFGSYRDNAWYYRARSAYEAGDFDGAVALFATLPPGVDPAPLYRAGALLYSGRARFDRALAGPAAQAAEGLAAARADFERLLAEFPDGAFANDADYFRARAIEEAGAWDEARVLFEGHGTRYPGSAYVDNARYHGALCQWRLADAAAHAADPAAVAMLDLAGAAFEAFLQDLPASSYAGYARYWLGRVRYAQQDWTAAAAAFEAAAASLGTPYRDNALYYGGMSRYHLGLAGSGAAAYQDAIARFDALLAEFPASSYADGGAYYRGRSLYQLARWADATAAFLAFLDRYADSPYRDDAWYQLVRSYVMAGDCAAALDAADRMAADVPGSPWLDNAALRLSDGGCQG